MIIPIICQDGEQGQITWNYQNESPQTADADEYEIQGASLRTRHKIDFRTLISSRFHEDYYRYGWLYFGAINYQDDVIVVPYPSGGAVGAVKADGLTTNNGTGSSYQAFFDENYPGYKALFTLYDSSNGIRLFKTEDILKITIVEPPRIIYEQVDVTFVVRNKEEQIFIRTEFSQIPSISTNCLLVNQCPDDSCRVDCGEYYCCYNSNGYSIHSYYKSQEA